jgi:hypothetical protein
MLGRSVTETEQLRRMLEEPAEKKLKTETPVTEKQVLCFKKLSDTAKIPEKGSAQAAGTWRCRSPLSPFPAACFQTTPALPPLPIFTSVGF